MTETTVSENIEVTETETPAAPYAGPTYKNFMTFWLAMGGSGQPKTSNPLYAKIKADYEALPDEAVNEATRAQRIKLRTAVAGESEVETLVKAGRKGGSEKAKLAQIDLTPAELALTRAVHKDIRKGGGEQWEQYKRVTKRFRTAATRLRNRAKDGVVSLAVARQLVSDAVLAELPRLGVTVTGENVNV